MGAEASKDFGEGALVDGDHNRGRGKVDQRRKHRVAFQRALGLFREELPTPPPAVQAAAGRARIEVAVRKRPLFEHEVGRGDFDAATIASDGTAVWAHRALMRADLKVRRFPEGTSALLWIFPTAPRACLS
eukprot:SAG11_NODE_2572_length_3210_cov_18.286725_6_plen_131_part_00